VFVNIFATINGVDFIRIVAEEFATGYAVIAQREYDPAKHALFVEPEAPKAPAAPAAPVPPAAPAAPASPVSPAAPSAPSAPAASTAEPPKAAAPAPDADKPATADESADAVKALQAASADETKAAVLKETSPAVLQALQEQEFARERPRKTVIDAIENRLNALQAAPPAGE
jgi:hypothetical protein